MVNSFCWYYIACKLGLAKQDLWQNGPPMRIILAKVKLAKYNTLWLCSKAPKILFCQPYPVDCTLNWNWGDVPSEEVFFLISNWVFNGQKIKNAPSRNEEKILNNFSNLSRRQKLTKADTHNQLCATFRGLCQIISTKYMSSRELGRLKFVSISSTRNWGNSMKYAVQYVIKRAL